MLQPKTRKRSLPLAKPGEGHIPKPYVTKVGLNPTIAYNAKIVLKIA